MRLADALVLVGQTEEYRETLERARWLIDAYPGTASMADRLEVRAAELTMRALAVGDASVLAAAESILATPALPPTARARLLGGLGRAAAATGTVAELRRGARQLARSAQLFTQSGAGIHAAASLTVAAIHANLPLGRYDLALEQLDQALHAGRDTPRARVAVLSHRPFVLIDLGRYQDAETDLAVLRRSAHGAGTTGNDRAAAYARWGAARIASQRGAEQPTWAACQAVASSSAIIGTDDHAAFAADAAQLLARVGRTGEARRFLHDAQQRQPGSPTTLLLSNFVVAAHAGEYDRAIAALAALEDGGVVLPRDRWRVTLLHAHVRRLHGHDDASALSAAAFEQAAQLGFPDLPLIREPQIARGLRRLGSPHSASMQELGLDDGIRLRVLGELSVERDGAAIGLGGRTGELFALLALHGRSVTVDRAIDALWPGEETRKGRERLRTVLHRTRTNHGPLIERRGSRLQLDADVQIDVEEFLERVRRARSTQTQPHLAASVAIDAYTGKAAPGYDDHRWVMTIRRHLERELLEMHDLMIAAAEQAGQLDEAIRAAEAATVIDVTAEHYHLTIARLLAEQGHGRRALWRLTDIRSTLLEQGLVPSPELRRLEAYLARRLGT